MNTVPSTALVTIHVEENNLAFPLAAAQLKAALKDDLRAKTVLCDFYLNDTPEKIAQSLIKGKYDRIGFSTYIWSYDIICLTGEILRKQQPGLVLFAGGPHITAEADMIAETGLFDYLITDEGENVLEKALTGQPGKSASGKAEIIKGEKVNLETLASPYLSGIIEPSDYPGILWELSRGCPYNCAFCYEARNEGWVRRFPMSRLEEELNLFINAGVHDIWILDSTFNHDKKWCETFLKFLVKKAPHIHFTFEIRAEKITLSQAELFGQLTASLQIGIQSTDPRVMAGLNRTFNPVEFRKKIKILQEHYLVYGFDLIYGLPGDSLEGFKESMDFALELSPSNIDIFPLAVLPGTPLADNAGSLGLNHDKTSQRLITGRPDFPDEDLAAAAGLTELCNYFYTKGLASMWFSTACKALELKPSFFLERFGTWLEQEDKEMKDEDDPAVYQKEFLRYCFTWRNKEDLFLPLNSFIIWHEALNRLMEGEDEVFVELSSDPESLTQLEMVGLENFGNFFPSVNQSWRIYTEGNGIYWEPC